MAKVKALRDFGPSAVGSRTKNERFDYDMDKDPAGLKKLGFVEAVDEQPPAPKSK